MLDILLSSLIGVGALFVVLVGGKLLMAMLSTDEEYYEFEDLELEKVRYLDRIAEERSKTLYTLWSKARKRVVGYDPRYGIIREHSLEDDSDESLLVFTEEELNSLGFFKDDEEYVWIEIEHSIVKIGDFNLKEDWYVGNN